MFLSSERACPGSLLDQSKSDLIPLLPPVQASLLRMDSFPPLAASPLASASPFLQCPVTPLPPGAEALHLPASHATPPPGFHTPLAPRSLRYAGSGGQVPGEEEERCFESRQVWYSLATAKRCPCC